MTLDATDRLGWLTWRRGGLGASDVAGILGISPWASPYSVWADKTDPNPPVDDDPDEDVESGRMLEQAVIDWYATRSGLTVVNEQRQCIHPDHDWVRCTLDAELVDGHHATDPVAGLEVKITSDRARSWETDGIPAYYQAQAQWQMLTTGHRVVRFAVLHTDRGARLRSYDLEADQGDQGFIFDRARAFWFEHVAPGVPPPADSHRATTAALAARASDPDHPPVDLDDDPEVERAVVELVDLDRRIDALTADKVAAENVIKAALDDATEGLSRHAKSVTWRPHERRSLDTTALRKRYPRATARFERATRVRPFKFTANPT